MKGETVLGGFIVITSVRVVNGGRGIKILKVAANILDEQWWTAGREWSCGLGFRRRVINHSP
jgi:hypothetical protein